MLFYSPPPTSFNHHLNLLSYAYISNIRHFRMQFFFWHINPLRKAEQEYRPRSISYDGIDNGLDSDLQKAISRLLSALLGHEVAFNLRSKIGNDNVATGLSKLFGLIQRGRYNYEHYRALSRLVIK